MRQQTILRTILNLSNSSSAHFDIFILLILTVMLTETNAKPKTSIGLSYIPNDSSHEDPKRGENRALLSRYGRSPAVLSRYGKRSIIEIPDSNLKTKLIANYLMPSRQLEQYISARSSNDFQTTSSNRMLIYEYN